MKSYLQTYTHVFFLSHFSCTSESTLQLYQSLIPGTQESVPENPGDTQRGPETQNDRTDERGEQESKFEVIFPRSAPIAPEGRRGVEREEINCPKYLRPPHPLLKVKKEHVEVRDRPNKTPGVHEETSWVQPPTSPAEKRPYFRIKDEKEKSNRRPDFHYEIVHHHSPSSK